MLNEFHNEREEIKGERIKTEEYNHKQKTEIKMQNADAASSQRN